MIFSLLVISSPAMAHSNPKCDDVDERTSTAWHHEHCYHDHDTITEDTNTQNKRSGPRGVGTNYPMWIFEKASLDAEYRFDGANQEHSIMTMVNFTPEKGIFQHIWEFVKKPFTDD
jgi:hypothetical protein